MDKNTGKRLIKMLLSPEREVETLNEVVDIVVDDISAGEQPKVMDDQYGELKKFMTTVAIEIAALSKKISRLEEKIEEKKETCKALAQEEKEEGAAEAAGEEVKAAGEDAPEEAAGAEEKAKGKPPKKAAGVQISRVCASCGKKFKAGSGAARYCPECKAEGKTTPKSIADAAKEIAAMDDEEIMQEQDNMTGSMNL